MLMLGIWVKKKLTLPICLINSPLKENKLIYLLADASGFNKLMEILRWWLQQIAGDHKHHSSDHGGAQQTGPTFGGFTFRSPTRFSHWKVGKYFFMLPTEGRKIIFCNGSKAKAGPPREITLWQPYLTLGEATHQLKPSSFPSIKENTQRLRNSLKVHSLGTQVYLEAEI